LRKYHIVYVRQVNARAELAERRTWL
jgi:hypothetical protein